LLWELFSGKNYDWPGDPWDRPSLAHIRQLERAMGIGEIFFTSGWNDAAREPPEFGDIVKDIESAAKGFSSNDQRSFNEYKAYLDREAMAHMIDPELWLLLLRTPIINETERVAQRRPPHTPLSQIFIRVFTTLVDPELAPRAVTVLRYVFLTNGCLDAGLYRRHMDWLEHWGSDRRRFGLGAFVLDPREDFGPEWEQINMKIKNERDLLRGLRNVLGLICGSHPSVLPFRGWNITRDGTSKEMSIVLVVGKHRRFEMIAGREAEFVFGILRGMSHLHSLGIPHGNLRPSSICLDSESNARIFDFG
jgi:hypothetical protein